MSRITRIHAREILDSRGNPTVEAEVGLSCGAVGRAAVPSGASTGAREAVELRDGDKARFGGRGVRRAVAHVNGRIREALLGMDGGNQQALDSRMVELDATGNRSALGANAMLAVSLASARAAAASSGVPLYRRLGNDARLMPTPMMNVVNGGAHADNRLDVQEFMVLPVGAADFSEALRWGVEVYHVLKGVLRSSGRSTAVGDEGGFAPDLPSSNAALEVLIEAIQRAGFSVPGDFLLGLDVAASELYQDGLYVLESEGRRFDADDFAGWLKELADAYPLASIEDGMAEDDWHGWEVLSRALGATVQLVGDDLFVTQTAILAEGIERQVGNAILIKPNQVGTLTETLQAVDAAVAAGYAAVISHRSGETADTFIADLAVGSAATQIKTGAPCRSDRTEKYNRLLRISEALGADAAYAGLRAFPAHVSAHHAPQEADFPGKSGNAG